MEPIDRINKYKEELGKELVILTHHYQRNDIVNIGDYRGDSFDLSQRAASNRDARFIVFCGVHFMAESAAILAQPHQRVQIPDMEAGCWMSDMADEYIVENGWKELTGIVNPSDIMPVVYMNSEAYLKALCGRNGGAVCTSSNAPAVFNWGLAQRDKIFFFPDQHLGRNTGNKMGLKPEEIIVWNPEKELGGNSPEEIKRAKLILWDGYCLVHTRFQVQHIKDMRKQYPESKVVVHPECTEDVVAASDADGSTSFIVNYVKDAPKGSTIIIGTEINLVERLGLEHPDKTIIPLMRSLCPNMYKIDPEKLLSTLERIGKANLVTVPESIKEDARKALDNMLALAPKK